MTQTVKNLPAVRDTWVQSLDWEDHLEKGMATHSWWAAVHGVAEWDTTERLTLSLSVSEMEGEIPPSAC